jgi:hypothetical protein
LFAPHYARPVNRRCTKASSVRAEASAEAEQISPLEPGDQFAVLDLAGDWAWGYRRADHKVGYVPIEDLE